MIVAVMLPAIVDRIASAQAAPLDDDDRRAVIERIGAMLEERYVFPDTATQCAIHLQRLLADGAFDDATHAEDLSERLTEALRSVSRDKHILVRPRLEPSAPENASPEERARMRVRRADRDRERNFGFERLERLDGNIGYLDLRYFAGDPEASATAAAAMAVLAHADALVIDLRHNGGGHPGMVRFLCSYLFDEPTHLNSLHWRDGDRTEEFWTLDDVPGTKMPVVPVFVLTSSSTFSGAEEFSYNLRTRERATLVGETTRGGANPGGVFPIDERFEIIIPLGRAVNPITGTNWEGTGVVPHIDVPAADALERALELARPAAEAHREAKVARWIALEEARATAYRLDDEGRPDEAARVLVAGVREAYESGALDEAAINICGYECLGASWTPSPSARPRPALAIAVLAFNVEMFPESANVHDSLGEAYRAAGDVDRAITCYERAIALQPDGWNADNARAMLAELREARSTRSPAPRR